MLINLPVFSIRNSIFLRMMLTYLFLVIPIIALGVYLYIWSYNNASRNVSSTTLAQIDFYLESLEHELSRIKLQQFALLEDNDLNRIALAWDTMNQIDQRTTVNHLLYRLTTTKNSSAYIKDIYIHIRTIDKTISAVRAVYDFDSDKNENMLQGAGVQEDRLIEWNESLHLNAFKQSVQSEEKPVYIVQVELDTDKLKESLHTLDVYPGSYSNLVLERSGFTIASATSSEDVELDAQVQVNKTYSNDLGISIINYLPKDEIKKPLQGFTIWAWVFAFTSIIMLMIYSLTTYRMISRPLLQLVHSFKRMESGELGFQIKYEYKDEFRVLYNRFNHMIKRLELFIDQDYKQKMMMQRAELKQLQSQIHPHFLYNNFFILHSLANAGDMQRIQQFTYMLGEYFRYITQIDADYVPLLEEIRHSRMYTDIQKTRFSRRIEIDFARLPEAMEQIQVPKLIVQPIIENAFKYSLEKKTNEGILRVRFETGAAEARIIIEDNGNTASDTDIAALQEKLRHRDEKSETTGLINIHRRLQLMFGEESGLFVSRSELNGMKVVMLLLLKG